MRTDELIAVLARSEEAVVPHASQRRFAIALGWGAFGTTLLMAILLGVRPDLAEAVRLPIVHMELEGLSVTETARMTGMSESAVKVGVHRGLKALASMIRRE